MTDTPIIDAAIRAGCEAFDRTIEITSGCNHPCCKCQKKVLILAALRAALPWEFPEARPEMAVSNYVDYEPGERDRIDCVEAAYRAQPIMRELYPEKF